MYNDYHDQGGLSLARAAFVGARALGTKRIVLSPLAHIRRHSTATICKTNRINEMHVARNMSVISIPPEVEASPSTAGQFSLGLSYFLTVFSTAMVILRFWSRKLSGFGIGLDDWLALATLFMLYLVLGLSVVLVYEGGVGKTLAQAVREQPMAPVTSLKVSGQQYDALDHFLWHVADRKPAVICARMGIPSSITDHETICSGVLLADVSYQDYEEVYLDTNIHMWCLVCWSSNRKSGRVPADLFLLDQAVRAGDRHLSLQS